MRMNGSRPALSIAPTCLAGNWIRPPNQLFEKYAQAIRLPARCSKDWMRSALTRFSDPPKPGKAAW